jgi:3-deoxy-manno-octulosonate cytidylyltransferase (CMP-KDO synthetase)
MQRTLVVIPARMQSTRLPNKPMADIHGVPMIVHVWRRAMAAETGRVVVATDTPEDPAERSNPNVVKVVGTPTGVPRRLRALLFTRATAPFGEGPLYHHIGIYAFRRSSLERFVGLRPGTLEKRERLEQLRALEDGMRIDVTVVDTVPLGVDTPADLERARALFDASGTVAPADNDRASGNGSGGRR